MNLPNVRTRASCLTACLLCVGCCDGGVHSVSVSLRPEAIVYPSYIWVGDSLTVSAVAGTESHMPCYRPLYSAADEPGRFAYQSTDTAVAAVISGGRLIARATGLTFLTATSAGVASDPLPVIVAPGVASLLVGAPAPVQIGDTIVVRVDALDAFGKPVSGAQVAYFVSRPPDSIAVPIAVPRAPPPYTTVATPISLRFRAARPGTATLLINVPHEIPGIQQPVTASVALVVIPNAGL